MSRQDIDMPETPSPSAPADRQYCTPATSILKSDPENTSEEEAKANHISEPTGDAGRKRRRPDGLSSCETCKLRKVKCDRAQPSCGWCSRNGNYCQYRQRRKPGLRAGIGRELEERLDRVEAVLASHSALLEAHIRNATSHSSLFSTPPATSPIARTTPPRHGSSITWATPTLTTQRPASSLTARRDYDINSLTTLGPKSYDADLPSDETLCSLVDIYFRHVHPNCPILHRQTVYRSFFHKPPLEVDQSDVLLMHAIAAAAMRFSPEGQLDPTWKESFREITKRKVIFTALEQPAVSTLRALVLVFLDAIGDTTGPPGWGLLTMVTHMALHLGLASEHNGELYGQFSTLGIDPIREGRDWVEDEGERRLFWMIYVLDVLACSSGTSLDLTIDDSLAMQRQLPCHDTLWERTQETSIITYGQSNKGGTLESGREKGEGLASLLAYQVEVVGILGRVHRFLRGTVDINCPQEVQQWQYRYRALDKELASWRYSLPGPCSDLTLGPDSSESFADPAWITLHSFYNTAVIRLHSSAAYPIVKSSIFSASASAEQKCLNASENIAALVRLALRRQLVPLLGSAFGFSVYVAARLLLIHTSSSSPGHAPEIGTLIEGLLECGRYWTASARYAKLLQRALDQLDTSVQQSSKSYAQTLAEMRIMVYSIGSMSSCGIVDQKTLLTRTDGRNEDWIDLFSWFNLPRIPAETAGSVSASWPRTHSAEDMVDWLFPV